MAHKRKKTQSGAPYLFNDTHMELTNPAVWYEAHLKTPQFELYGHFVSGLPFALLGQNRQFAWGLTMFENDDMDFFEERVNPEDENQVWFKDHWENLDTEIETINVKNQKPVKYQVRSSRHGPIVNDILFGLESNINPISMWWGAFDTSNDLLRGFYGLSHSTDLEKFKDSISKIKSPGLNILYASAKGDIAIWSAGLVPVRPKHTRGYTLLDGSSGKDEYLGFYSVDELPHIVNPESGVIVSANESPEGKGFKGISGYYAPDFRADRIHAVLSKKEKWSIDELKNLQNDDKSEYSLKIKKMMISILEGDDSLSEVEREALSLLARWEGTYGIEEIGSTVFYEFLPILALEVFADEVGDERYVLLSQSSFFSAALPEILTDTNSPWWNNVNTPVKETQNELVLKSWKAAVANLKKRFGSNPDSWHWGRVHTLLLEHPVAEEIPVLGKLLNIGPFKVAGSREVVNNLSFPFSRGDHAVSIGPSTRRAIDMAAPQGSYGINTSGQSGFFLDKHYDDQAMMFSKGEYRQHFFDKKDIMKNALGKLIILPSEAAQ
ncbi:MAG: penicillin acylase family protein [Oligoflexales bacterium]|nr:penicillin acylase family protein [Oligoflexales bacterium]